MAIHIGVGNFSGAIAANIYRSKDTPRFLVGRKSFSLLQRGKKSFKGHVIDGVELMFVGIGLIVVPILIVSYIRINKKRDAIQQEALDRGETSKFTKQQLRALGDRAPDFRYTL